jgi:hypothetical protein
MSQNNGGTDTAPRKKLELPLNQPITAKILRDKPYEGENHYGKFHMWGLEVDAEEMVYFPEKETHEKLLALQLKVGDVVLLTRTATQSGKKISSQVTVDVILRSSNGHSDKAAAEETGNDGYRQLMELSLRDAIDATKAVNTVQWDVDSIRGIALTLFIQRVKMT